MRPIILFALAAMLLLTACGGENEDTPVSAGPTEDPVLLEMGNDLAIRRAWGRSAPAAAPNGVFYMTVMNGTGTDDTLVSVESEVCGTAELHETYMQEGDIMGMRPVEGGVPLPSGGVIELEEGGLHIMCLNKTQAFEVGDEYPVALNFASGESMETMVEIRDSAPE